MNKTSQLSWAIDWGIVLDLVLVLEILFVLVLVLVLELLFVLVLVFKSLKANPS